MEVNTAISLGIGIAGFIGGVFWKIVDLSVKFGKLSRSVDDYAQMDRDDREKTRDKFTELYSRMNSSEKTIAEFTAMITNLSSSVMRIEGKVDKLMGSTQL